MIALIHAVHLLCSDDRVIAVCDRRRVVQIFYSKGAMEGCPPPEICMLSTIK